MDSKQFRKAVAKAGYVAEDPVADARLAQVCATLDEIARLEALLSDGLTTEGSKGQIVTHPALAALVRHRTLLDRLLVSLFPDDGTETVTEKRRRAGQQRWISK